MVNVRLVAMLFEVEGVRFRAAKIAQGRAIPRYGRILVHVSP